MNEPTTQSRHLPASHARRLDEFQGGSLVLDGRSIKWLEKLAETDFVSFTITKEKKRTTVEAFITARGKNALERNARGVDPYLVMT